jgi:hypothetical protein
MPITAVLRYEKSPFAAANSACLGATGIIHPASLKTRAWTFYFMHNMNMTAGLVTVLQQKPVQSSFQGT